MHHHNRYRDLCTASPIITRNPALSAGPKQWQMPTCHTDKSRTAQRQSTNVDARHTDRAQPQLNVMMHLSKPHPQPHRTPKGLCK